MSDVKRFWADLCVHHVEAVLYSDYAALEAELARLRAVPDEPMKPAAVVNDHYSRDGVNDEISAFLPVGTQLYTARQLEDLRSVLALERARYYELFAEFMAAAPSAPATVPSVNQQLIKALEAVLNSGRGTSGRIILDAQDEADVRAAIAAARKG